MSLSDHCIKKWLLTLQEVTSIAQVEWASVPTSLCSSQLTVILSQTVLAKCISHLLEKRLSPSYPDHVYCLAIVFSTLFDHSRVTGIETQC